MRPEIADAEAHDGVEVVAAGCGDLSRMEIRMMRQLAAAGFSAAYVATRLACSKEAITTHARALGVAFGSRG